ncbi:uncharacterized protein LOC126982875 [Eriocheir sinensis]|uniref:uncharacterized protein LOC126982875 n=2 Tax=Eriocheir sinensis TaxID=95602 RepID=UPI0021CA2273|nr:uncharacterized protein LOC126982875 [Eriocheir sinensis]
MSAQVPDEEYEAQVLGFSPSVFIEAVEEAMAQRLKEALDQVEEQFSQLDPEVLPEEERREGMAKLRAETDKNFAKVMQKTKTRLHDTLRVPPHVLHPADVEQANPVTAEEVEVLKLELEGLRQELLNERYMKARCETQLKHLRRASEEQQKVLEGPLSPAVMHKLEDTKERLCLIRDNQDDLLKALEEVREVTKSLPDNSSPTPAMLLAKESFQ